MADWCSRLTGDFAKPLMVTEFAWWADWTKPFLDREGVCQHNGIWASLLGGAAGTAQSWWWEHIDEWNRARNSHALKYNDLLAGVKQIKTPKLRPDTFHIFHLYVIRTRNREALQKHLGAQGIQTGIHYPVPMHRHEAYADLVEAGGK
jgi:hypothetical protein